MKKQVLGICALSIGLFSSSSIFADAVRTIHVHNLTNSALTVSPDSAITTYS